MSQTIMGQLLEQQGKSTNPTVPQSVMLNGNKVQNTAQKTWKTLKDTARLGEDEKDAFAKVFRFMTKAKCVDDAQSSEPVAKKVRTSTEAAAPRSASSVPMIEEAGSDEEAAGQYQIAPESKNPMIAMMREFRDQMQHDQEQFRMQLRQDAQASMEAANQKVYEVAVQDEDTRAELIAGEKFQEYAVQKMREDETIRAELIADKDFRQKMVEQLAEDDEFHKKLIAHEDFQANMVEVTMLNSVKVEMESMKKFHPCFKFQRGNTDYFDCVSDNVNRFIVEAMSCAGVDYDERKSLRQNIEEHVKKEKEEVTESEKDEEVAACGSEDEDETGRDESPLPPCTICDKPAEGSR